MLRRLRDRQEWKFFGVLPKADRGLAVAWWIVLVLRGVLPAAFAVAMGALVGAVKAGDNLTPPLTFAGVVFVLLQVLEPGAHRHQRQSRRPHGGVALRPTHRCLRRRRPAWATSRIRS